MNCIINQFGRILPRKSLKLIMKDFMLQNFLPPKILPVMHYFGYPVIASEINTIELDVLAK